MMDGPQNLAASHATVASPPRLCVLSSAARYLFGKILTIAVTIFVGVFLTILMVSYPVPDETSSGSSPFETRLLM